MFRNRICLEIEYVHTISTFYVLAVREWLLKISALRIVILNSYLDKTVSAYNNNHSENTLRKKPVSYIRVSYIRDKQIIQPRNNAGQDHIRPLCHSI